MKIEDEEYEVVGFIKKICVCDKCNQVMERCDYELTSYPAKYAMKCPKCGKVDYVDCDILNGEWKLRKKVL